MLPYVHEDSPLVVVSTMEKSLTPGGTVKDMGTGSAKLEPGSFWKVAAPAGLVVGQLVSVVLNAPAQRVINMPLPHVPLESMSTVTHVPDGGARLVRTTKSCKLPELKSPPYALGVTLQATGGSPLLNMRPNTWMLADAVRQGRASGAALIGPPEIKVHGSGAGTGVGTGETFFHFPLSKARLLLFLAMSTRAVKFLVRTASTAASALCSMFCLA
jgi:hypothetical protein